MASEPALLFVFEIMIMMKMWVKTMKMWVDGELKTGVYKILAIRGCAAGQTFKSELTNSD